jgi:RNase P/RNase MRP subunit p29
MKSGSSWTLKGLVLAAAILCLAFAVSTNGQVQTTKETSTGMAAKEVQVERGEVVTVSGNDLVVKMEDGSIRHFPNVPESAKITVDGKQLGIHDLKPGMKLQRTITTTTTPQTVTTVQTVTGIVWVAVPPLSVTLTLEDGKNQTFKIPKGQKFNVDGQMLDAFALKKGMRISATKIVEVPETIVTQTRKVTGTMPPPPPAPPADMPMLIAEAPPAPPPAPVAAAAPAAAPAKLPKTGSQLPLIGLLGLLCLCATLGVRLLRGNVGL